MQGLGQILSHVYCSLQTVIIGVKSVLLADVLQHLRTNVTAEIMLPNYQINLIFSARRQKLISHWLTTVSTTS